MKLSNIIKLIAGNFVVLLVFLLMMELVLRIRGHKEYPGERPDIVVEPGKKYFQKDSLLGYKHLPGKYEITLGGEYKFVTTHENNSLRITSDLQKNDSVAKPEVWMLGCSFTHGWSINDNETFTWLTQAEFKNYKFVNWGTSGYGTLHFYLLLKKALEQRDKPKLVIINHANFHFGRNTFSRKRRRSVSRWNFLGKLNQPFATLDEKGKMMIKYSEVEYMPWMLSKYSALANYFEAKYDIYLDKKDKQDETKITELILDEISGICSKYGVDVLITNIGDHNDFIKNYCDKNNKQFVDISVDVSKDGYNNLPFDSHPSAIANKVYAEKLSAKLNELLDAK